MVVGANIKEALRSLISAKQRTLLALIGIVVGIASVIAMVSIGNIVKGEVLKQFKELGTDIISVRNSFEDDSKARSLTVADVMQMPQALPTVRAVAPYLVGAAIFVKGDTKLYLTMLGVTQSFQSLVKLRVREGRFISDLDENNYYCVIGDMVASQLYELGFDELIGNNFRFGNNIFTVIGILEPVKGGNSLVPNTNEAVITHITTGYRTYGSRKIDKIVARTDGATGQQQLIEALEGYLLPKAKGLSIQVQSAEELIAQMEKQMELFTMFLGAVGSIALLVGGVGVMNVMLVSVSERKKEIGIRRAIGAQQSDIQFQFIVEAMVLCMIGGVLGIGLGVGVSYIVSVFSDWTFMFSYAAIFLGAGVSTFVGLFFGFYPSRQAARLEPITALRS